MGRHSRCVVDICDIDISYIITEIHKKHSNVDRDIIMHKLPKDGAVKAAWIILRKLLGLRKPRSSKKVETLQV